MAVAEEPVLKQLLGIPDPYAVAAAVPLGKPAKQLTKLTRARGRGADPPRALGGRSAAGLECG